MKIRRTVEKSRLYNAGDRIEEVMMYSLPDGHDIHCVAHYRLVAPEKEFFFVTEMFEVRNGVGEDVPIYPRFTDTLLRADRWGGRGVVLVDPEFKDEDPEDLQPVAASDKAAIAKAGRILERYEKAIVQAYIDQCNEIAGKNGKPIGAAGYTKKLLGKYGVVDPSQAVLVKTGETQSELEKLKQQLEQQQREFNQKLEQLTATLGGKEAKGQHAAK